MIWVGLDLHKRYITAGAVGEGGAVVLEMDRSYLLKPLDAGEKA